MKKVFFCFIMLLSAGLFYTNNSFAMEEKTENNFDFQVNPIVGIHAVEFEIFLKNKGSKPITFQFPTSQKYEITVLNDEDKEVYVYSAGRSFYQAIQTIVLNSGEEKRWSTSWDYIFEGQRIPEGKYKLVGQLSSNKRNNLNVLPVKYETSFIIKKEGAAFQNIIVTGSKGKYKISGEARPVAGEFYYSVEDGHNEYIGETKVRTSLVYPKWSPFQFEVIIPETELPKNASIILNLFEKNKNGETVKLFPVILERFT